MYLGKNRHPYYFQPKLLNQTNKAWVIFKELFKQVTN